jgi:tetratricopeptide (TPR) repeat protein
VSFLCTQREKISDTAAAHGRTMTCYKLRTASVCFRLLLLIGAALLSACYPPTALRQPDDEIRMWEHLSSGKEALRRGDYTNAEKEFKRAVSIVEKIRVGRGALIEAYYGLAQVYEARQQFDEAERAYQKRIELGELDRADGNRIDATYLAILYDNLATFYLRVGRPKDARPIYVKSIELLEATYGHKYHRVAEKLEMYSVLFRVQGDEVEAAKIDDKLKRIRSAS